MKALQLIIWADVKNYEGRSNGLDIDIIVLIHLYRTLFFCLLKRRRYYIQEIYISINNSKIIAEKLKIRYIIFYLTIIPLWFEG